MNTQHERTHTQKAITFNISHFDLNIPLLLHKYRTADIVYQRAHKHTHGYACCCCCSVVRTYVLVVVYMLCDTK